MKNDQQVTVEHGTGAIAPAVQDRSQVTVPESLSVHVIGHHAGRAKLRIDRRAIGDRRGTAGWILWVRGLLYLAAEFLLPEFLL